MKKKLFVVGSGIKTLGHFTKEFITCATQSDIVLFLNNDHITKEWYEKYCKKTYDLNEIYQKDNTVHRKDIYLAIADYVIKSFDEHDSVCFSLYGHPFFCAQPALYAIDEIAREREDIEIHSFAAVSALDCLWNDLRVNPAENGMQMYEASHMIYEEIPLISKVDLVILQAGFIDIQTIHTGEQKANTDKLKHHLLKYYHVDSQIIIYQAAQYPSQAPVIDKIKLNELESNKVTTLSTIYIAGNKQKQGVTSEY
ncbi:MULTISPECIES: SAM-dependent methyltransferase [Cysteiniphilum]|uniref:SAM-dependent methyltransferase n=1 Tax=Cysteiniphilum TaxID=2056696 RepID=UPI00178113AD|nr:MULTISPECIES: SAM-dependent methyltransferase [Cysteiniphilum]